jgi:hypothetical protein
MGSMSLVPFDSSDKLPARLAGRTERASSINKDVVRAPAYPSMSIKGKVFTIVKDGVKKILTKPDDPDEVAQNIGVVMLRANMGSKNFYLNGYVEGQSDGNRPDCFSNDGVAPHPNSPAPQAKKCAVCPHNQWGSRVSADGDRPGTEKKGKACSDQARLAIAAPDKLEDAMLLRVPPASLKNLRAAIKLVDGRKLDYNEVVMKVGFDPQAASPTLTFKPVGILGDAEYEKAKEQYDSELVRSIVGLEDHFEEAAPVQDSPVSTDELDAALAARDASRRASESSAGAAAPAPAPAPSKRTARAPAAAPKPAVTEQDLDDILPSTAAPAAAPAPAPTPAPSAPPAASSGGGDLMSDLDALLGGTDD